MDAISQTTFSSANVWIPIKISLKFVPLVPINNIAALVQIMAWRRPGDKPLSEPMMVSLTTHICVTLPQWVKSIILFWSCSIISILLCFSTECHLSEQRVKEVREMAKQSDIYTKLAQALGEWSWSGLLIVVPWEIWLWFNMYKFQTQLGDWYLIFNMGIPILVKRHLYIEMGPSYPGHQCDNHRILCRTKIVNTGISSHIKDFTIFFQLRASMRT